MLSFTLLDAIARTAWGDGYGGRYATAPDYPKGAEDEVWMLHKADLRLGPAPAIAQGVGRQEGRDPPVGVELAAFKARHDAEGRKRRAEWNAAKEKLLGWLAEGVLVAWDSDGRDVPTWFWRGSNVEHDARMRRYRIPAEALRRLLRKDSADRPKAAVEGPSRKTGPKDPQLQRGMSAIRDWLDNGGTDQELAAIKQNALVGYFPVASRNTLVKAREAVLAERAYNPKL